MFEKLVLRFLQKVLAALLIGVVTAGCCTEKYCIGIDDMNMIRFEGLENAARFDTILIERYAKGAGFAAALDKVKVPFEIDQSRPRFWDAILPEKLNPDFDYVLILTATGKSWKVSDFTSKKRPCNSGFLCADSYKSLESYRVNGAVITGDWQVNLNLSSAEDYDL